MLNCEALGAMLGARVTVIDLSRMTYNRTVGFVNVPVAEKVPVRDGHALGATQFANTQAAYEDLPADVKSRLAGATATHDRKRVFDPEFVHATMGAVELAGGAHAM